MQQLGTARFGRVRQLDLSQLMGLQQHGHVKFAELQHAGIIRFGGVQQPEVSEFSKEQLYEDYSSTDLGI